MGQFGNQPDFGTRAITTYPQGDADYNLLVTVVGGDPNSPYTTQATLFENIPSGTFMPVMVSYIWEEAEGSTVTTCSSIIGIY